MQIDGNRVPSSGSDNSFNPRQLSADSVTFVEVIKAAQQQTAAAIVLSPKGERFPPGIRMRTMK